MPRVGENCGVVGIYSMSGTNVIPMAIDALRDRADINGLTVSWERHAQLLHPALQAG